MKILCRWLFFCCLTLLPLGPAAADDTPFKAAILQHFFIEPRESALTLSGEKIHGRELISRMYLANDYRRIWSEGGIQALSSALEGLAADGLKPEDYRFAAIETILASPKKLSALEPARAAELDILLTEAFVRAVYNLYFKAPPTVTAEAIEHFVFKWYYLLNEKEVEGVAQFNRAHYYRYYPWATPLHPPWYGCGGFYFSTGGCW